MGWIILALLLFLLLLPFLIPVRVKLRLDESTRDWALYYGLFQLAPDTTQRLEDLRVRVVRWTRIPLRILLVLGQGMMLPFQLIILLYRALARPFQKLARWRRDRRMAKQRAERDAEAPSLPSEIVDLPPSTVSEPVAEEGRLNRRDQDLPLDHKDGSADDEAPEAAKDEPTQPDSPWDLPDEEPESADSAEEPTPTPPPKTESSQETEADSESDRKEEGAGLFGRLRAAKNRVGSVRDLIDLYLGYVRNYSPLAKRILRRVFRFLGRCMRAFRFRTFDAHLRMGGDPATLGAMLGWHHALAASIHPSIPGHLVFEPDYESEELAPRGTLDLELVVWPYRFLLPTLILVATMPWWSIYKVVRNLRKQDSA